MTEFHPPSEDELECMKVPSTLTDVKGPEAVILDEVARYGYDEDATFAIKLALEEAMTNAVRHGNQGDESKHVHIGFRVTPAAVVICIRDEGPGFRPEDVPDPTAPDRIALPSGRGIMLMRAYMTDVQYRARGTEVWLFKKNPHYARKSKATKGA